MVTKHNSDHQTDRKSSSQGSSPSISLLICPWPLLHSKLRVAVAKTIRPTKPKNLLSGLFQKVCRHLPCSLFSSRLNEEKRPVTVNHGGSQHKPQGKEAQKPSFPTTEAHGRQEELGIAVLALCRMAGSQMLLSWLLPHLQPYRDC